jgi:D-3-phosphoglycerate dehydrogenase
MAKKYRVLVSDRISKKALETLEENNIDFDYMPDCGTSDTLIEVIEPYAGLIIRSASKVSKDVIKRGKNLQVIGRAGIGVDNIDLKAASSKGIVVMNTPHGNAITTAEHTLALIFAASRQIPAADHSTRKGKWEKSKFLGQELTGKTLGLIGVGNIGSIVADRALGLKLKVKAYDPFLTDERVRGLGIERVKTLEKLVSESDIISLHLPKTDKTINIINSSLIKKMKSTAILVNCARGGLVDEAALANALKEKSIAAAAFDVFSSEPALDNALFGLENVVCTPHLGASTSEAQVKVAVQVAEQISDYLQEGAITNSINAPSISAAEAPLLKPWVKVSDVLGGYIGQVIETGLKEINIEYVGSVGDLNTRPLTCSIVAAILNPIVGVGSVNLVSSLIFARERGVTISEIKKDSQGAFGSYIRVLVKTERAIRSVAGTVYSDGKPRFIQINGIDMDTMPQKFMLYTSNIDSPGFIGLLGTTLGRMNVNIATFSLGRQEKAGLALALLGIDEKIDPKDLNEIKSLKGVKEAKTLSFDV